MEHSQIIELINSNHYDFLRNEKLLSENIILLTVGGSHAYGTSTPDSDLDIRGCYLNSAQEILTGNYSEQFIHNDTDTVIYSFNKLIRLLVNCNPNVIEILGNRDEDYFYLSPIGTLLIDNSHLFLSKRAINSFGGYAHSQLRRLDNKAVRTVNQVAHEEHILNSIKNAANTFDEKYKIHIGDQIRLYIDESENPEFDSEIFMDVNLSHYPLRDYKGLWSEMNNIVKDYSKIGRRNKHAAEHGKLGKHMMHLVRLYYMCFDILEKEKIITYRQSEHDFLMDIRNGKFLDNNNHPVPEFYDLVNDLEKRLEYAKQNTSLPNHPNMKKINELIMSINYKSIQGEQ